MLTKLLALVATLFLLIEPGTSGLKQTFSENTGTLAQTALVTACIGPMTLQVRPKDRGLVLLAFAAGGCSTTTNAGFGLRFGKIKPFMNTAQSSQLVERIS